MTTTLGNINLFVRDVQRAVEFYTQVLGLVENKQRSVPPSFALLQAGSCTLTLQDSSVTGSAFGQAKSIELGFAVEDIEAVRQHFQIWGVEASEIQQMGWGGGFDAVDLDGHRLTIYRMTDDKS